MSSVFELYKGSTHHIPRSSDRKQLSSGISSIFHGTDSGILSVKFQISNSTSPLPLQQRHGTLNCFHRQQYILKPTLSKKKKAHKQGNTAILTASFILLRPTTGHIAVCRLQTGHVLAMSCDVTKKTELVTSIRRLFYLTSMGCHFLSATLSY